MNIRYSFALTLAWMAASIGLGAQTWTGSLNNNWSNPGNWSPSTVPNSTSATAVIPPGAPNLPVTLSSNIQLGTLVMGAGTSLNINFNRIEIHVSAGLAGVALSNGTIEQRGSSIITLTNSTFDNIIIEKRGNGNIIGFGGNTFNGNARLEAFAGTSGLFSMGISLPMGDNFTGPLNIQNASNNVNISIAEFGANSFGADITMANTANGSITFGANFAVITLNGNIHGVGNIDGTISLRSITQNGGGTNNLGNPASLILNTCTFSGNVTCTALTSMSISSCNLNGSNTLASRNISQVNNSTIGSVSDTSSISRLAPAVGGPNNWFGGNTFRNVTIRNFSNANLRMATSLGDTWMGVDSFQNLGNALMEIGYFGTTIFSGDLILENTSNTGIYIGNNSPPHAVVVNGNLKNAGFTAGALQLRRVMQMAPTPNDTFAPATFRAVGSDIKGDFFCTPSQSIQAIESSTFSRENLFASARIQEVTGSTFSNLGGKTQFIKSGAMNDNWSGNNNFYIVEINNNSPSSLRLANAALSPDYFHGKATFLTGSAELTPCSVSNCHFRDTISTVGTTTAIIFGGNTSGDVIVDGNSSQIIEGDILLAPSIRRLQMNTTGSLTLNVPVTILNSTAFINGVVNSSMANIFRYASTAMLPTGSNTSHVDGPVEHTRTAITHAFTFPTGNGGWYAPVTIQKSGGTGLFGTFRVQYLRTPYGTYTQDGSLDHVSQCEYWNIDRPAGSGSVNIMLTWDSTRSCGVTDYNYLRVARWSGSSWTNSGGIPAGTNASGVITAAGISSFSPFTLASSTMANPLPVELLYFNAEPNGNKVVDLHWATASEKNNDYFTVERSRDGLRFEALLRVPGAGTTSEPQIYAAVDAQPLPGLAYYRLRQTDYDGAFSYSHIVAVQMPLDRDKGFAVYPNPVLEGAFWLDTGLERPGLRWRLLNSMGQTMPAVPQPQGSRLLFNTQGLPAGVYFLEVQHEGTVQSFKLVLR